MTEEIVPQIIRAKRRTLTLQITRDAELVVRAPEKLSLKEIYAIIQKRMPWILKRRQIARERLAEKKEKQFSDGEEFRYLGNAHKLFIAVNLKEPLVFENGEFLLDSRRREKGQRYFTEWYKKEASRLIPERVNLYAESSGIQAESVAISHGRQRLGSCAGHGRLNFSWRLILAPLSVIDYVAAHELAHIRERNHSPRFWKKVGEIYPDYRAAKKWIRASAHLLDI